MAEPAVERNACSSKQSGKAGPGRREPCTHEGRQKNRDRNVKVALQICMAEGSSSQSHISREGLYCVAQEPLTQARHISIGASIMIALILAKVQAFLRYRSSVRELSALSDRELADIGLDRGRIDLAARSAAGL